MGARTSSVIDLVSSSNDPNHANVVRPRVDGLLHHAASSPADGVGVGDSTKSEQTMNNNNRNTPRVHRRAQSQGGQTLLHHETSYSSRNTPPTPCQCICHKTSASAALTARKMKGAARIARTTQLAKNIVRHSSTPKASPTLSPPSPIRVDVAAPMSLSSSVSPTQPDRSFTPTRQHGLACEKCRCFAQAQTLDGAMFDTDRSWCKLVAGPSGSFVIMRSGTPSELRKPISPTRPSYSGSSISPTATQPPPEDVELIPGFGGDERSPSSLQRTVSPPPPQEKEAAPASGCFPWQRARR